MTLTDPRAVNAFNARILVTPEWWSRPLREVFDTYESVLIGLSQFGHEDQYDTAIELTKLVLDRHDAIIYD